MSETREILITRSDYDRLWQLVDRGGESAATDALEQELDRATVVPSEEVAPTVVTMNSEVEIVDLDSGERRIISVVFPHAARPAEGKVSVLAPIGMAVLGAAKGDVLEWQLPRGLRRFRVERILFQPEAAGQFDL
jgi:regulator of nucleoside diphosphate kinase